MTMKDVYDGGMSLDEPEFVEALPDEALAIETPPESEEPPKPEIRHLSLNGKTLCGAPGKGVHPSKVKKDDCAACREKWRELKTAKRATEKFVQPAEAVEVVPPPIIKEKIIDVVTVPTTIIKTTVMGRPIGSRRWKPTLAEIKEVKDLRESGVKLAQIDELMGWPDSHGNRPWRILQGFVKASDAE
jgi:hypothetical protein